MVEELVVEGRCSGRWWKGKRRVGWDGNPGERTERIGGASVRTGTPAVHARCKDMDGLTLPFFGWPLNMGIDEGGAWPSVSGPNLQLWRVDPQMEVPPVCTLCELVLPSIQRLPPSSHLCDLAR